MKMTLAEIAVCLGGSEKISSWACRVPSGACIDSRKVRPGELFFCLSGEHADGHDFAVDAARAGACAIIASRDPFSSPAGAAADRAMLPPVFLVEDPLKAMWRLAMRHRDMALARVIAVTGSAGKTSVKEVLAHLLGKIGPTERNPMNLNNQIGLPLSMLNASTEACFWVMEAGISEEGDMDELGSILRPDAVLILNVGEAHLSGLGKKGVAANKALLLDYIQPAGLALVSADYPDLVAEADKRATAFAGKGVDLAYFSTGPREVFSRAQYLGASAGFAGRYRVLAQGREQVVHSCFQGDFGSENVAAVAAAAFKMGLDAKSMRQGFSEAVLPEQRFNRYRRGALTLVDDSYNANPLSCARMLNACRSMADESDLPLYLIMGEMRELGELAQKAHEELGRNMAAVSPEEVFWKGGQAGAVLLGLQRGGYAKGFYPVSDREEFSRLLDAREPKRGLFLFKGSRANRLEAFVDILRARMALVEE